SRSRAGCATWTGATRLNSSRSVSSTSTTRRSSAGSSSTRRPRNRGGRRSVPERLDRRTRADGVAVAGRVVDPRHEGPELPLAGPGGRERPLLPAVRPVPTLGGHRGDRVGRVAEGALLERNPALLDGPDLAANRDERVAEAVELGLRLALRGLD